MGMRIVRELIRRPWVRSPLIFEVLKGITLGENVKAWEKTLTDTSKFVMTWRFDLYPKVFLKGFERRSQKRQAITNLLVSVNIFNLIFEVFVDLQLLCQCRTFLPLTNSNFFGWEEPRLLLFLSLKKCSTLALSGCCCWLEIIHKKIRLWCSCFQEGLPNFVKRGSVTIFSDFLSFFCASKKWRLLAQVSWTLDHDSSVSRAKSFTALDVSSESCFPRENVVFRGLPLWPPLFFPTQNGCQKSQIILTLPL